MEFKGTKVEWNDKAFNDSVFDIISGAGENIGYVYNTKNGKANAKLISKAPELLELLNHFVEISDELSVPDHLIETFANLYANSFNTIQEATTI